MSVEMLRHHRDPGAHAFSITDAARALLFEAPFSEVTRPAERRRPFGEVHASIERHQKRAAKAIFRTESQLRSRAVTAAEHEGAADQSVDRYRAVRRHVLNPRRNSRHRKAARARQLI